MNSRVTFSKITRWVVFFLALLPLIFLVFYRVKIHFADSATSSNDDLLSLFESALTMSNGMRKDAVDGLPWYQSLLNILSSNHFVVDTSITEYCFNYFNYLVLLSLIDLIFYAFTFFLSLIRSFVNKFGGDL